MRKQTVGCLLIASGVWMVPGAHQAAIAKQEPGKGQGCELDASQHEVRFVSVEPGVGLEVLDWGGAGNALVLLAGLGDNAHVFDDFAYQFIDRFRVLAITRRGYGRSSQPAGGMTPARGPAMTPPEVSQKIVQGIRPADYSRIDAPALGIFNAIKPSERLPYYWSLDPAAQQEFARRLEPLASWMAGAIQRFRDEVKGARVVELEDTSHYLFLVEEALVVREMRSFLLEK